MIYHVLSPVLVDTFEEKLLAASWQLHHQEAGQLHFVGWGYNKTWHKMMDDQLAQVTLYYEDVQGKTKAHCELNTHAKSELMTLFNLIEAQHVL